MLSTFSCNDSDEKDDDDSGKSGSQARHAGMAIFCRFYRGPVRSAFGGCVSKLGYGVVARMMRRCVMDIRYIGYDRRQVLKSRCNAIENLYDECGRRTKIRVNPWRSSCGCSEYHLTRYSHILLCFYARCTLSEYTINSCRSS